jgi:hemolysin III
MARPGPTFSPGEELAHAVTHGLGLVMAVTATYHMLRLAQLNGDPGHAIGVTVFGVSMINLYAASTFCHALPPGSRTKEAFTLLDYTGIYGLIAGTYTPFMLGPLRGPVGWTFFIVIWVLALFGMLQELAQKQRNVTLSMSLYLAMGWMGVLAGPALATKVPWEGLMTLLAGGICYTAGTVFYLWRGFHYHHAVWHVFVLGGSALHVVAVIRYAIPSPLA